MDEEMTTKLSEDPGAPGRQRLLVAGSVTIDQAAGFKEALLGALEAGDELEVNLDGITELDLTGLQLLCSAHQSATVQGKRFFTQACGSEIYRKVAADAGFYRHVGCSRDTTCSCIWVGGEN